MLRASARSVPLEVNYAASRSASIARNQLITRIQLTLFWSTILRSPAASFGSGKPSESLRGDPSVMAARALLLRTI
jgi:hypothetical protein